MRKQNLSDVTLTQCVELAFTDDIGLSTSYLLRFLNVSGYDRTACRRTCLESRDVHGHGRVAVIIKL